MTVCASATATETPYFPRRAAQESPPMPAPMMHTSTSSGSSSDTQPAPSSFSSEEIADAEKRLVLRDGRERARRDTPRGDARAANEPRAHVVAGPSALDIADERRAGRHPNRASGL